MRFDFADLSPAERYKLLGGLVVPRPIALVTTCAPDGHHNAAPFSFSNVMAEEPPIVVLGLGISAVGGAKDTTNNINAAPFGCPNSFAEAPVANSPGTRHQPRWRGRGHHRHLPVEPNLHRLDADQRQRPAAMSRKSLDW